VFSDFIKKIVGGGKSSEAPRDSAKPFQDDVGRADSRPANSVAPEAKAMIDSMFEDFQRQAEGAQAARSARFRAHVERVVPPMSDAEKVSLGRAQVSKLAIRHVFPPRVPQRSLSFLGGAPIAPDDFDWPAMHNREGVFERLNFMAQIDCADIPSGPARDLLPDKGYIYFFAPMSLNFGPDVGHFVVRYLSGPARKSWEPQSFAGVGKISDMPAELAAFRGSHASYPRVEIELGWLEEPSDSEIEARGAEGFPHVIVEKIRKERATAFLGPPLTDERRLTLDGHHDASWLLEEDYPTNRAMARTLRDRAANFCFEQVKLLNQQMAALNDDPAIAALKERKAAMMALDARISAAFAGTDRNERNAVPPLSDDEKGRARAFLKELLQTGLVWASSADGPASRDQRAIYGWMAQAAIKGAEAALLAEPGPEVAPIPEAIVTALALRHDAREHHLLGNGDVVQVAAEEMKERHILLLQLGRDPEMDWLIGEMGPLQYWITPDDLRARRFENTMLTIEAY